MVLLLLKRYWWIWLAIAGVIAVTVWKSNVEEKAFNSGVTTERTTQLEGVVTDVQTAKKATTEVSDPASTVKYCQCVRSARTPENCKRFLPTVFAGNSEPGTVCKRSGP